MHFDAQTADVDARRSDDLHRPDPGRVVYRQQYDQPPLVELHQQHPDDGRKVLLHLTGAGLSRLQRERTRRASALGTAIRETFAPEEQRRLSDSVALLSRLAAHLSEH
ncbi:MULTISPECIES: hypothetical protein [Streptomyces]|uniref:hypothetical protein n=1 Tax=Streptomyces TaxID=1883 RepID=UPI001EFA375B|nr:hypothetical protein [Streptomyces sp. CL12-4]